MGTGVLLLVAAVSAAAVRLLGPQALTVVQSPAPARVEDAVTAAALVLATMLAAWYLTTALLGLLAGLLRVGQRSLERRDVARRRAVVVRVSAATLEGMVRRFGAPALRRGLAIGVGLGLAVGSVPALAAPLDEAPLDLRPGASSDESTHDAGAATTPPTSGSTDTGTVPSEGSADSPVRVPAEAPSGAPPWQTPTSPSPAVGPAPTTPSPSRPAAATPAPAPPSQPAAPWVTPTTTPPPVAHASESPEPPSTDEQPEDAARHTVAPGESLWRIAADRLGPGASDTAVAQEWPRWYAANAAAIGPDPNLIRPGQELLAPPKEAGP